MKILVTGGEGFIGSYVVEKLSRMGHRVTTLDINETYDVIDRKDLEKLYIWRKRNWKKVKTIQGDVTTPLDRYCVNNQDVVIHLASYPRAKIVNEHPELGVENIVGGTTGLLEKCIGNNVKRFVYVSSSMIYGNFMDGTNEDYTANPNNIYGEAKLFGEKITKQFHRTKGLEYVVARPSGVYGPGDIPDRVVSKFFSAAMNNETLEVHNTDNKVDFTYVEDAAEGIVRCALEKKAANNTFNITAGKSVSLGAAAEKIIKLCNSRSRIKDVGPNKLYPDRGTLDISRATALLKYRPQYNFDQGIIKYYEWLQNKI